MKHTKEKWIVRASGEVGTEKKLIAVIYPIKKEREREANAHRICQCVNNFDDLLRALEIIIKIPEMVDLEEYPAGQVDAIVEIAKKAIVRAGGKEPLNAKCEHEGDSKNGICLECGKET